MYIQNIKGHTPLQLSPPNIITIVMKYVDRYVNKVNVCSVYVYDDYTR